MIVSHSMPSWINWRLTVKWHRRKESKVWHRRRLLLRYCRQVGRVALLGWVEVFFLVGPGLLLSRLLLIFDTGLFIWVFRTHKESVRRDSTKFYLCKFGLMNSGPTNNYCLILFIVLGGRGRCQRPCVMMPCRNDKIHNKAGHYYTKPRRCEAL